jgi:predicted aspartyl protease
LKIDGRPLVDGPEATVLPLAVESLVPIVELQIVGTHGHSSSTRALVDTGAFMYMALPHAMAENARPWIWQDSVGRVRTWSFGKESGSLGVMTRVDIGASRLSHVPINVAPKSSNLPGTILGLSALSLFDSLELDWARGSLTLLRHEPGSTASCADLSTAPGVVPFRWWHPRGDAAGRENGGVAIGGKVAGSDVELLVDTGCGGDLVLPRGLAAKEPWVSALEEDGSINIISATGTSKARRFKLRRPISIGGESFTDLLVAVFDDSMLPPGATALPILGAPVLRRFERVTIDFANERVILDARLPPAKVRP